MGFKNKQEADEYVSLKNVLLSGKGTKEQGERYKELKQVGLSTNTNKTVEEKPKTFIGIMGQGFKNAYNDQPITPTLGETPATAIGATGGYAAKDVVDTVKGVASMIGGTVKGLDPRNLKQTMSNTGRDFKSFISNVASFAKNGTPQDIMEGIYKKPVTSVLTALGGAKMMETPKIATGFETPTPVSPVSLANKELALKQPSMYKSLREPLKMGEVGVTEYYNGVKNIYDNMGNKIKALTELNPDKVVDISGLGEKVKLAMADDPVLASRVNANAELKALAEGIEGAKSEFTLSELQNIKNKLTAKTGRGKMEKGGNALDVQSMEVITDLNQEILNNFPDMVKVNAEFGTDITNAKLLKKFGNIKTATSASQTLVGNQAERMAAQQFFSPEYYNTMLKNSRVPNIGFKGLKLKDMLEKKKFTTSEAAGSRAAEVNRRTNASINKGK